MDQVPNPENHNGPRLYKAGNWYPYVVMGIFIFGSFITILYFDTIVNEFYLPFISNPLEIFAATYRAYFLLLPEMLDLAGGILILTLDMIRPNKNRLRAPLIAQTVLILSYFPVIFTMYLTTRYFNAALGQYWGGLETIDPFSLFLKSIALITVNYVVVIAMRSKELPEKFSGEFYAFLMFATVAIECVVSSSCRVAEIEADQHRGGTEIFPSRFDELGVHGIWIRDYVRVIGHHQSIRDEDSTSPGQDGGPVNGPGTASQCPVLHGGNRVQARNSSVPYVLPGRP
jgi:hypothetical protein